MSNSTNELKPTPEVEALMAWVDARINQLMARGFIIDRGYIKPSELELGHDADEAAARRKLLEVLCGPIQSDS